MNRPAAGRLAVALRPECGGQVVGGAVERHARRPAVDAQGPQRVPRRNDEEPVVVDLQRVAGDADLDGMLARRNRSGK